jgi:hypothetical protein
MGCSGTANKSGWMKSIYAIPGIASKSYPLAANPINITAGFRQAGIVPFDRKGFNSKADYDPGFVTDRMDPTVSLIGMPPIDEPFFIPLDISPDQVELFVEEEVENIAVEPQVQENVVDSDEELGGSQQNLESRSENQSSKEGFFIRKIVRKSKVRKN